MKPTDSHDCLCGPCWRRRQAILGSAHWSERGLWARRTEESRKDVSSFNRLHHLNTERPLAGKRAECCEFSGKFWDRIQMEPH